MAFAQVTQRITGTWRRFVQGSTNRQIFGALVTITTLTFAAKLASMLKDVLVAASFGTGDAMDAFLIAYLLPQYIQTVVAGSFNSALIPIYIQVRETQGREAAQRLFSNVVILSVALLTALSVALGLAGPYLLAWLGSGFSPEKLALTRSLFYLLLPAIAIGGLTTIWESILNAGERFALTSLITLMIPLTTVVALLLFGATWGIYTLAFGIIGGSLIQLYILSVGIRRQGMQVWPRWCGADTAMWRVLGQYVPMVAGALLISGTSLVDQSIASISYPGSVAILSYGNKLVSLMLSVGIIALGTAVLPFFSKMVAVADWSGIRHSLKIYSLLILLVTLPITFLAYVFSKPLISLVYQRGAFTEADAVLVSRVQMMYVLQIPFHTLGILFVRLISSLQGNQILMWGTLISFVLNITLDYALLQMFGLTGIAASTSLVYTASCIYLFVMLYRKLRHVESLPS